MWFGFIRLSLWPVAVFVNMEMNLYVWWKARNSFTVWRCISLSGSSFLHRVGSELRDMDRKFLLKSRTRAHTHAEYTRHVQECCML